MPITIRTASEADIPLIRQLAEAAFPPTYAPILTPAQLDYMMAWMYSDQSLHAQFAEGQTFYIAALDGEPCGYLSIEAQGPSLFHLQKIYVVPAAQGSGVGEALFRRAVAHVRTHGLLPAEMELNVNRHNRALGFYERMGMQRLRSVDLPIGEGFYMNDYIMGFRVHA